MGITNESWVFTQDGINHPYELDQPFKTSVNSLYSYSHPFMFHGKKSTYYITTLEGYNISASPPTQLLRIRRCCNGGMVSNWVVIDELKRGDRVMLSKHPYRSVDFKSLQFREGWLVGVIFSRGIVNRIQSNVLIWFTTQEYGMMKDMIGPHNVDGNDGRRVTISGNALYELVSPYYDTELDHMMSASYITQSGFLRALIDLDSILMNDKLFVSLLGFTGYGHIIQLLFLNLGVIGITGVGITIPFASMSNLINNIGVTDPIRLAEFTKFISPSTSTWVTTIKTITPRYADVWSIRRGECNINGFRVKFPIKGSSPLNN